LGDQPIALRHILLFGGLGHGGRTMPLFAGGASDAACLPLRVPPASGG
jgi:hypothetical protein